LVKAFNFEMQRLDARRVVPNFFNVLIAFCAGIFIVRSFKNVF